MYAVELQQGLEDRFKLFLAHQEFVCTQQSLMRCAVYCVEAQGQHLKYFFRNIKTAICTVGNSD
jgi:hypothetical protein